MKRDILSEIHDLRLLLLLYGATNHWSGWLDGLARCITPVVADILSKDLDFRRKSLPIPYARYDGTVSCAEIFLILIFLATRPLHAFSIIPVGCLVKKTGV